MARAVVQRVRSATVAVESEVIAAIGRGLLVLVGISRQDGPADIDKLADKIAAMRIFSDDQGKMNLSVGEVGGSILVVSQFTLMADVRKGNRPSFIEAARPDVSLELYERFAARLRRQGRPVSQGQFGANMIVSLENAGPVTIALDSAAL
ncbi:MAG: D-aminoacyl-tRNA deacylase [Chloroflexota bacterium]